MAYEGKSIKAQVIKELVPRLEKILNGWKKKDPPTNKKILVGIDIPEFLADLGRDKADTALVKAVGEFTFISFYYLLRVG